MDFILRQLMFFGGCIGILELIYFISPQRIPRIPGDIYINKLGLTIYIPFASAIALSVVLNLIMWYLLPKV
jgi:hypothetical protein